MGAGDIPDTHLTGSHDRQDPVEHDAVQQPKAAAGGAALPIPQEIAARLPKTGRARIIVLTAEDGDDAEWRSGAYEQFLREDPPEDSIYDSR